MKKYVKKMILLSFLFSAVGFLASSCATNKKTFSINRVRHAEPRLAKDIPLSSFTILGNVSGEGNVKSNADTTFEGDTGLYGSLDWDDAIYLNLGPYSMPRPTTAFEAALGNALYQMIEEAERMNADIVLFVRTKTQVTQTNNVQEVYVKVKGVAAKLK